MNDGDSAAFVLTSELKSEPCDTLAGFLSYKLYTLDHTIHNLLR